MELNDILTIAVIILGPIGSVFVTRLLDNHRFERQIMPNFTKDMGFFRLDGAYKYRQFSNVEGGDPKALSYLFLGPAFGINFFSKF